MNEEEKQEKLIEKKNTKRWSRKGKEEKLLCKLIELKLVGLD